MKNKPNQKKKVYEPPKIDSKIIYEVNALGCAKCPNPAQISLSTACVRGSKKFS